MTFTPTKNKAPGYAKRHQEYLNLREQFSKYGSIPQIEKLSIHMRVFSLLLMFGENSILLYKNLRELQGIIIVVYIKKFMDKKDFGSITNIVHLTLRLESSIGRSIRKIREDDAMSFHPDTYAGKSSKHQESAECHGENIIEELGDL